MSRRRQSLPFSRYSLSPERNRRRVTTISPALKVRLNLRRRILSTTCGAAVPSSRRRLRRRGPASGDYRPVVFFVGLAGTNFLGVALGFFGAGGAQGRLVPVIRHVVLHIDLGLSDVAVHLGIDQRERHLGHAHGFALARAHEDDVLHVDAAQQARRLLAQHPRDGVGDVRLAAAVRTDDGGDAFALEAKIGAVAERLESEDLQLLQFEQRLLHSGPLGRAGLQTRVTRPLLKARGFSPAMLGAKAQNKFNNRNAALRRRSAALQAHRVPRHRFVTGVETHSARNQSQLYSRNREGSRHKPYILCPTCGNHSHIAPWMQQPAEISGG